MRSQLIITLIFLSLFSVPSGAQVTIAIGDFENNSDGFHLESWESSIPEFLKSELSRSENIIIVERRELESVLKEQALSMTGLVDSATAQKVGSVLGATFIISGTINMAEKQVRIDAKIIRTSTGQVRSEKVEAPNDQYLSEMVDVLGNNLIFILLGEGNYQHTRTLKKYPTVYFLLASTALAASTIIVNNAYWNKVDQYRESDELSAIEENYNAANQLNNARIILASLTGTAILGTLYCWINDMSAEEIIARREQTFVPNLYIDSNGDVYASFQFRF